MPRPELQAPPEIFYNDSEARKYTTSSRIAEIQARISERAYVLLALPDDGAPRLLLDIDVALEREVQCFRCLLTWVRFMLHGFHLGLQFIWLTVRTLLQLTGTSMENPPSMLSCRRLQIHRAKHINMWNLTEHI